LTETWFSDNYSEDIDGYTSHHVYRTYKIGGGVSIYTSCNLKCTIDIKLSDVSVIHEICHLKLCFAGGPCLNVLGIYRPPVHANINVFNSSLENMLSNISVNEKVIMCGDVNVYLLNPSPPELEFIELLRS
jgi:exonuclease III